MTLCLDSNQHITPKYSGYICAQEPNMKYENSKRLEHSTTSIIFGEASRATTWREGKCFKIHSVKSPVPQPKSRMRDAVDKGSRSLFRRDEKAFSLYSRTNSSSSHDGAQSSQLSPISYSITNRNTHAHLIRLFHIYITSTFFFFRSFVYSGM